MTVVPVSTNDEQQMSVAEDIYKKLLNAGLEVVIDDRNERPGVKFKDADLIGFPYRITVGKTIVDGKVELVVRETGEKTEMSPEQAVENVINAVKNALTK